METKELTLNEVLRHSMHDYLNNLHLIQMNLDMGRQDEAKDLIRKYSLKCKQFFDINNTGLISTNEWLQTFSLVYNKVSLEVQTSLHSKGAEAYDALLKSFLQAFIQSIYTNLEGYDEQLLHVHILTNEFLEVQVNFTGNWSSYAWVEDMFPTVFRVEKEINTENQIKFTLIASERLE